jgi:PAS domain S-box-containing protein
MTLSADNPIPAPAPLDPKTLAGALLSGEGVLAVVIDPAGRILQANRACERLIGQSASRLVGRSFWEALIFPAEAAPLQERLAQSNAGRPWLSNLLSASGGLRRISWTLVPVPLNEIGEYVQPAVKSPSGTGPLQAGVRLFRMAIGQDVTELMAANAPQRPGPTTQELDQTRLMQRQVLEALPLRIFWKDRQSRYMGCNQAFAEDAGFASPGELIGRSDYDIAPAQNAARYQADDRAIMDSRQPRLNYDELQIKKDGRQVWVRTSKTPLIDRAGQVYGILGIFSDVTTQKQVENELRESERRFRATFEHAGVGIIHTGMDHRLLRVNPRICELLGYTQIEMLSRAFEDITHPDDLAMSREIIQPILSGEVDVYRTEKRYLRKDGSLLWAQISVSLVRSELSEPLYFVTIVEDISERKQAQLLLEERTRDLARSNADLEQFAYLTSHDLQEPLRMVASFTQLLERRYRGQLDERADDYIHFITEGAQRMQRLINDLLTYSRVGSRGRPFAALDAEDLLRQAAENLQIAMEEAGAILTHDALPRVSGDESQLIQLLQNLIGNAIKFRSAAPPQIHVSAQPKGSQWVIAVRDNGIGIDPQYFERIFVLFQRLHLREEYPGTGIGLAICKRIVERHNGRIWVESTPGQGSTFYFSLPSA